MKKDQSIIENNQENQDNIIANKAAEGNDPETQDSTLTNALVEGGARLMGTLIVAGFIAAYLIAIVQACMNEYPLYGGFGATLFIHSVISFFMGFTATMFLRDPGKRGELMWALTATSFFSLVIAAGIGTDKPEAIGLGAVFTLFSALFLALECHTNQKQKATESPNTAAYQGSGSFQAGSNISPLTVALLL